MPFSNYLTKSVHFTLLVLGAPGSGVRTTLAGLAKAFPEEFVEAREMPGFQSVLLQFHPSGLRQDWNRALFSIEAQRQPSPDALSSAVGRADGIVVVVDSRRERLGPSLEVVQRLLDAGVRGAVVPRVVFQFNHRDAPDALRLDELRERFQIGRHPDFETVASAGLGLTDTFSVHLEALVAAEREFARQAAGAPPDNPSTVLVSSLLDLPRATPLALLKRNWASIVRCLDDTQHEPSRRGLLFFGIAEQTGVLGVPLFTAQAPDAARTLSVGRHSASDIVFTARENLALRQLLLILPPGVDGPLEYRAVHLRSEAPTTLMDGTPMEHVLVTGPLLLRVAKTFLFLLPLDDQPRDWAASPENLAQVLAKNVPRTLASPTELPADRRGATVGWLEVFRAGRAFRYEIDDEGLARGVLLGRSPRCDEAHAFSDDSSLSRVHCLVTRVGVQVMALDCGSTNGVVELVPEPHGMASEREIDALPLGPLSTFRLGHAVCRWTKVDGSFPFSAVATER